MMTKTAPPYMEKNPGDLIKAEDWNELQCRIQEDIEAKSAAAVAALEEVGRAGDAEKLGGRTPDEWLEDAVARVLEKLHAERGYRMYFKRLKVGEETTIEHQMGDFPLVDVYQLDYFPVVFCEDKETFPVWTLFYLQHGDEKRVRYTTSGTERGTIDVQPPDQPSFRLSLGELLQRFDVDFTRCTSLSDVEHELWTAIFERPGNDDFLDDQYGHSPWFDKHCREEMSMAIAKRKGYLNNLWIQLRPRKTVSYPGIDSAIYLETDATTGNAPGREEFLGPLVSADELPPHPAATQIEVVQHDLTTVGLKLLREPFYPELLFQPPEELPGITPVDERLRQELNVMVLLKT